MAAKVCLSTGATVFTILREKSNFEEASYLLLYGELPTQEQLDAFNEDLQSQRSLPEEIFPIIESVKDFAPDGCASDGGFSSVGVRSGQRGGMGRC